MKDVAFCACSYVRSSDGPRPQMVKKVFESWRELLQLPFGEKIFLDDHSPNFRALRLLEQSGAMSSFTRVQYQTLSHAPHSNFGIAACLELSSLPYIVHLDDDVFAQGDAATCGKYIRDMIEVMEDDPTIMGGNLLSMDASAHKRDWLPDQPYARNPKWSHPVALFGTSACVLRRELLQRVSFAQIVGWGASQPTFWENLASRTNLEFIVGPLKTPFGSRDSAFFNSSTATRTLRDHFFFHYFRFKKNHPSIAKIISARKRILTSAGKDA